MIIEVQNKIKDLSLMQVDEMKKEDIDL